VLVRTPVEHPTDEVLEEYCFNRLPLREHTVVEQHLSACSHCREALDELDDFVLKLVVVNALETALSLSEAD